MRGNGESRKQERRDEDESPPDDPLAGYTPKQRERVLNGLRILARVAIRAHMKRQAETDASGPPQDGDEEKRD